MSYLQQLITGACLEENASLMNGYIPREDLMDYLTAKDIYLFTTQAVSGTFLYDMPAGYLIISKSLPAKEMPNEIISIILTTNKPSELAKKVTSILQSALLQKQKSNNVFLKMHYTRWEKAGWQHAGLFYSILNPRAIKAGSSNHFINY